MAAQGERRNLEHFHQNPEQDPLIRIPEPYPTLSTSRVLTMDRLDSIGIGQRDELLAKGYHLSDFDLGGALNRMMEIIRRYNIILPAVSRC